MPELRHFILKHEGAVDPQGLRAFLVASEGTFQGCDIYDLRSYPLRLDDEGHCTLDSALEHLIKLRYHALIPRRKAVILLPPVQSKDIETAFAAMRSMGLLAVVVVANTEEEDVAQVMAPQMQGASVHVLNSEATRPLLPRQGFVNFLRRKIRTI